VRERTVATVTTGRGPVEYASFGEGAAILALHGAMGGHDQARFLARAIGEEGYRYIALSRPGYLGTPLAAGRTAEEQADLYAGVLDALGVRKAGVMAVSGGGPSAIAFALRHPARCWGLVLVSTAGRRVEEPLPLAFHLLKNLARIPWFVESRRRKVAADPRSAARRSISDPAILERTFADPEVRPFFTEFLLHSFDRMPERVAGTVNDVAVTRTAEFPLERITVPTLVVHGTRDRLVPFEKHGKALAERIPGAELVTVEGGEHVAIFTHREMVRPRVVEFLRRHAPS